MHLPFNTTELIKPHGSISSFVLLLTQLKICLRILGWRSQDLPWKELQETPTPAVQHHALLQPEWRALRSEEHVLHTPETGCTGESPHFKPINTNPAQESILTNPRVSCSHPRGGHRRSPTARSACSQAAFPHGQLGFGFQFESVSP